MRSRKASPSPAEVQSVQSQFARWRATKSPRERIPARLWRAATRLCRSASIFTVARALRLNHTDLKKRVQSLDSHPGPKETTEPAFVELGFAPPANECVVELEDSQGARLKVILRGRTELDLTALTEAFWSRGS